MTLKQAIKIVESHNKWRRDNNVPPKTKMGNPTELGKALDVLLIVAKDYCKIYDMDKVDIKPNENRKNKMRKSAIERNEQYKGSLVQCNLCGYKWVAVFFADSDKLECPNCRNMTLFNIIEN